MSSLIPCPLLINGEWLTPKIGSTPVFNPSTGDVIAECITIMNHKDTKQR